MGQSRTSLQFSIDVSDGKRGIDELTRSASALRKEIAEATKDPSNTDWNKVSQLYSALNNNMSARGQIMNQVRQTESDQARENKKNGGIFGSDSSDFGKYLLAQTITKLADGIIQAIHKGFQIQQQRAGGDLTGAAVSETERTSQVIDTTVGALAGAIGYAFGGPIAASITANLAKGISSIFTGKSVADLKTDLTYSGQYKKVFPDIDSLNQLYGGNINQKSLEENNVHGLQMYGRATSEADWTGLTTSQFVEAMKTMGGYGVRSETQALNMAQNQALWSRFTGTDLSTIQNYAGKSYRYGGEYGGVSTAYGALMANGMGKGQFSEFLNSMSRILEEGISKGFIKSSSQIAGNMTMLYKLSGNSSLWQGEQGAQRLSQMNNAIANSTKLESVEDVMNFAAAKEIFNSSDFNLAAFKKSGGTHTGTYADYMQLLEQGVSLEMLGKQFEAVRNISGGNTVTMIERFRNMYGLNYTGAAQVWDMSEKMKNDKTGQYTPEKIAAEIKAMQTKPEYQSDSAKLQNAMNKVADNLANIGKIKFDTTEMRIITEQAKHVLDIRNKIVSEEKQKILDQAMESISDPQKVNDPRIIALRTQLQPLVAAENNPNPYVSQISKRLNNELLPLLAVQTDISPETMNLIKEIEKESRGMNGGRGTRAAVMDENRFDRIEELINKACKSLDKNTDVTEKNTNKDTDINLIEN